MNSQKTAKMIVDVILLISAIKHPMASIMLGVVASQGKKMETKWFPVGTKVDAHSTWLWWGPRSSCELISNFLEGNVVWPQAGTPSHTARITPQLLQENLPASLDLSLAYYGYGGKCWACPLSIFRCHEGCRQRRVGLHEQRLSSSRSPGASGPAWRGA